MGFKELVEKIKNWFKNLGKSNNHQAIAAKSSDTDGEKGVFLDGEKFRNNVKVITSEPKNEEIKGELFDYTDDFLEKKDKLKNLCNEINQLVSKYRMVANKEIFLDKYGNLDEYKKEYKFDIEQDTEGKVDYVKTEENAINRIPAGAKKDLTDFRKKAFKEYFISKVQEIQKVPDHDRSSELKEIASLYKNWGDIQSLVGELMGMQKATLDHYSDLDETYEKKRTRNW